jgi:hypothetical protein
MAIGKNSLQKRRLQNRFREDPEFRHRVLSIKRIYVENLESGAVECPADIRNLSKYAHNQVLKDEALLDCIAGKMEGPSK